MKSYREKLENPYRDILDIKKEIERFIKLCSFPEK